MANLILPVISPKQKAIKIFLAIITLLVFGKLISLIPVMDRLQVAGTYKAAEIVWFGSKLSALVMFFFFTRAMIAAIPNNGSSFSFFRDLAEPLSILLIVIIGQELLWQLLEPFVQSSGKKIYFSLAIILIVSLSAWLVFRAYRSALYLLDTKQKIINFFSHLKHFQYKKCIACGSQVTDNAVFCSHCGIKIDQQPHCTQCDQVLLSGEKFCQYCGTEAKK